MKKKICVSIPCYNEEKNIQEMAEAVLNVFNTDLKNYDCCLQFIDNCSTDRTRALIIEICKNHPSVRAIFNARNFGAPSGYYGLMNCYEDCAITMSCDFQDPVEMIAKFVHEWEKGSQVVCGIAENGGENRLMWGVRSFYYQLIKNLSSIEQIQHFTGFGLYDKSFLDICRRLDDPMPSMRGQVAEFGSNVTKLKFSKPQRRHGKTKQSFYTLFSLAMRNITVYTRALPRFATIGGFLCGGLSLLIGIIYSILKLIYWKMYSAGVAPLLIGVFFVGGIQLFFIGLLGEYVMNIDIRVRHTPLVIEAQRINFNNENEEEKIS